MASIFLSYSHKDEDLRNRLETHLAMLKREGVIEVWHDRRIQAGEELETEISRHLDQADIILLLVSPDFLASKYCYDVEVARAMERHRAGAARVIPVILRPCDWQRAPFGGLLAVPQDGRPITKWTDLDDAFLNVTRAIRDAAVARGSSGAIGPSRQKAPSSKTGSPEGPRSSNLRVRKTFTDADRDRFLEEAFEYMARYFENSLEELGRRNPGIETSFKRVDATHFVAVAYRNGQAKTRCQVGFNDPRAVAGGITYSATDMAVGGGFNEIISVAEDDQGLALKALGLATFHMGRSPGRLTFEGGAEYYWSIFIEALQR